uniref:Charged multivesicular body protein 4b n=1 Tax=Chaetoceros debilis TaxID=122233 RepID=A0A7S3QIC3_9STRA|mmetsp:Transcript_11024/g.16673  ORF Transcript_11024/g.16673 Transcript_11024/m.16673 type:complete len:228 (+) Transcript_11024:98-781(+)
MNWFGKKKAAQPSTTSTGTSGGGGGGNPGATIIKIRESIEAQEKREAHKEREIDKLVSDAKAKMAKGDKKGALYAMKRKKLHETELNKIQQVKMTLETQVINLESAAQNADTFAAMNAGKNAMAKIRNDVGIDKVDNLMDDIKDEMDLANEISDAIAQPVDPFAQDEDDLLAELEQMGADDLEAELLQAPSAKNEVLFPDAPASKLPSLDASEAEEMKKLEAELAGL